MALKDPDLSIEGCQHETAGRLQRTAAMNLNRRPTSPRHTRPHVPTPPAAIWLPTHPTTVPAPRPDEPPASAVLPNWAVDRIRAEFTRPLHADQPRLPLLRLSIPDCRPGMDTRTRCTTDALPPAPRRAVILAELHPDALPTVHGARHPEAAQSDEWPGFFHRTHHLLARGGFLLAAARQQRLAGRLSDPLGALVATARSAGFTYLQHIVVVHARLVGDRIEPTPPLETPPGLLHSDLLVFERNTRP
ncbi:hypothetical protein [Streptomyces sp. RPT161]|uniref:hypothetical protein n=1 Tax=Streptomyces sp. RPT161 TaxID=3015993 RepID=UPI0022B8C5E7|nr:hypothetical protein [Streptomyces sp. RPT161]